MQTYQVRHRDRTTLFSGNYRNLRECIEDACLRGVRLDGADFSHLDLSEINLDGLSITSANFSFTNLTRANLSEAILTDCHFENTSLFNTCLCHSAFTGCRFTDVSCGGTDIAGASFTDCILTGWDLLGLDWTACASMSRTVVSLRGQSYAMTRPPLVLYAALHEIPSARIAMLDDMVAVGDSLFFLRQNVWHPRSSLQPPLPAGLIKALGTLASLRGGALGEDLVETKKSTIS